MTPTDGEPGQGTAPEQGASPGQGAAPEAQGAPPPATLAERIRAVRDAWKWSQEGMAEVLRVDQASVSFWERGKIRPSGSALVALAALFRATPDALEKGEGFVVPSPPARGAGPKGLRALPRPVCLPVAEPGAVAFVDLGSGALSELPPGEAAGALDRCAKDGRRIWIVAE